MMKPKLPPPSALHLIDTGGPGGAETVFCQLATRLNGRPLRSVPVVPREGWLASQLRASELQPHIAPARGSVNIAYLRRLLAIVRAENVKMIHAHLLGASVYAAAVGGVLRLPVIGVFHGPTDFKSPGRLLAMKRLLLSRAAQLVAVSAGTRTALTDFGIAHGRIELIPNGIDTSAFSAKGDRKLRQELGVPSEGVLIGAVGNIRAPKAYDILLKAAALVLATMPNAHFAVVGEGDDKTMQPLLTLREELRIGDRFHFLGFRKTTADLLGNFDVFVSSSRSEGLPLSFLEAMACGLGVVATRSGGAQEVLTEESGILVPIEDPRALAAALERMARDSKLRARLGAEGRRRVAKDFSIEKTVTQYETLYDALLARSSSRA